MKTTPLRVLIVDDHADTARMMKVLLKREGYEVKTAFDGPEALEAAEAFRPDIVLLDLTLPSMGGLEVAEELRRTDGFRDTLFIAVSGYRLDELPSAFDGQCTKPVDHDVLMKLLAERTGTGKKRVPTLSLAAAQV